MPLVDKDITMSLTPPDRLAVDPRSPHQFSYFDAGVAEPADAPDLKFGAIGVRVRPPPPAPIHRSVDLT